MNLHCGTNRVVLLIGRTVIKVPVFWSWRRFIHGVMANYHEYELWQCARCYGSAIREYRKILAPVLWKSPGAILVCMARTQPVPPETPFPNTSNLIPIDPCPNNLGRYRDRIVLHDYGPLIPDNETFKNLRKMNDFLS